MRKSKIQIDGIIEAEVNYPDNVCFVFNPNYIEIGASLFPNTIDVWITGIYGNKTITPQKIAVSIYKDGKCKIYISRLLELMFDDIPNKRSAVVSVALKAGDATFFQFETIAVWGSLAVGERLAVHGVDSKLYDSFSPNKKEIVWFKNYPFTVSLFKSSYYTKFQCKSNSSFESVELNQFGVNSIGFVEFNPKETFGNESESLTIYYQYGDENKISMFDETYDSSYLIADGHNDAVAKKFSIHIFIDNSVAGHYLRWVDRHGNLQYYLFLKGTDTFKNKPGTEVVQSDSAVGGMYFPNFTRTRNIGGTITHKCCAINLPNSIFEYVAGIITSPIVDLYMGKDESGEDIWIPVKIESASVSYLHKKVLNDFELSFSLPDLNPQSL